MELNINEAQIKEALNSKDGFFLKCKDRTDGEGDMTKREMDEESNITKYTCARCDQLFQEKMENLFLYNDILTSYVWNHQMDIRGLKGALANVVKKWFKESDRAHDLAEENRELKFKLAEETEKYEKAKAENETLEEQLLALGGPVKPKKKESWRRIFNRKK